tara:strand:+ start:536 stop:652 length:117 start_codon:yes stop_codon:yes gene_type:complete
MIKLIFGMIIGGFIVYHNPNVAYDIWYYSIEFIREVIK